VSSLCVTCVTLLSLCCSLCHCTPLFYNISMDGSGDEAELELLFPTSFSTRAPVQITSSTGAPTLTNTITTTMIRLKDFVLSRVVDFLQENLLIIIVVTSLLIVMVFIICCASAMSHKRKLEAYKPPPNPPRKYAADKTGGRKNSGDFQERPMASPKNLRQPSKALVGERGREVRSSPRQEVRKARDVEAVEKRREEPKYKEQVKYREEVQQSSSPSTSSSPPVCTCHLKKASHVL
uniref:Transmembrane protein 119a n=1 Tax=Stegastes partitus TaxID=144197 RepID=A0A3B4ZZ85_9TELE